MPGSSPHARGKRITGRGVNQAWGLIPACAGKTTTGNRAGWAPEAHPRMRGENLGGHGACQVARGSSPHARGKPGWLFRLPALLGLIPACAGKTKGLGIPRGPRRAHPRMRGENR